MVEGTTTLQANFSITISYLDNIRPAFILVNAARPLKARDTDSQTSITYERRKNRSTAK